MYEIFQQKFAEKTKRTFLLIFFSIEKNNLEKFIVYLQLNITDNNLYSVFPS